MGRNGIRLVLWTAAIAAIVCCVSCENSLSTIVKNDVDEYKESASQTPPSIDSFTITSGAITYTGVVTFTLSSQTPGTGAASITSWQVNESATRPSGSDAGWKSFTSPVNDSYTLSSPGTFGARTIYAWLKNDKNLVSTPATQSVQYAQMGGPVIDSFTRTSDATSYDGTVSFSLGSTHPGEGATSITHWLVNENPAAPLPSDAGWQAFSSPTNSSYTLSNPGVFGSRTVYAWLKNDKNVVSASASFSITYSDYGAPSIDTFTLTSGTPTDDPHITFNLSTSNFGAGASSISGWLVSETQTTPPLPSAIPNGSASTSYDLTPTAGTHTVYAWVKNEHNKVSAAKTIPLTINHRSATLTNLPFITGHEKLTINFDVAMDTSSITLSGTGTPPMNPVQGTWSNGNTALTVSSASLWPQTGGNVMVNGKTSYQIPIDQASQGYTVFYGVCVSIDDPKGNDTVDINAGTVSKPLKKIASGIAAVQLHAPYIGTGQVRVAQGTYTINWYSGTDKIVMVEGISLLGGYSSTDWSVRNSTHRTEIVDQSPSGSSSPDGIVNRAVSVPRGVTSTTTIDGFVITGGQGTQAAAICCIGSASPTISNNEINAGGGTSAESRFAIYLTQDGLYPTEQPAPVIKGNNINQASSAGSSTVAECYGIYCNNASSPDIQDNLISGGTATDSDGAAVAFCDSGGSGTPTVLARNTIDGGSSQNTYGAYLKNTSLKCYNNLILGKKGGTNGSAYSYGIYIEGCNPQVYCNTIISDVAASGADHKYGVYLTGAAHPDLEDNIIAVVSTTTPMGYCVYCSSTSDGPTSLKNNDLYNIKNGLSQFALYYGTNPPQAYTTILALETALGGSVASGNASEDPKLDSSSYHITSNSPDSVKSGGLNLTGAGIATDREGNARPATGSWSMGCFKN